LSFLFESSLRGHIIDIERLLEEINIKHEYSESALKKNRRSEYSSNRESGCVITCKVVIPDWTSRKSNEYIRKNT
jgi:hypothetical protein